MRVDLDGFRVLKTAHLCKIRTAVPDPCHFVVQSMPPSEKHSDRTPPKFVVVTSPRGSEVIRICPKQEEVPEDF
ncbi:hypothetical protein PFISCL1PPCAC_20819, partial [Pristionchus fissidentatus]